MLAQTTILAAGELVNVKDYPALFSVVGTQFGGDGVRTFALPALPAVHANNGPAIPYYVFTSGVAPPLGGNTVLPSSGSYYYDTYIGTVLQLPYSPSVADQVQSLALCTGQVMPIGIWPVLYNLFGLTYGGNSNVFLLPNLPTPPAALAHYMLVTNGIYRRIRHPMYSAFWLWAIAQALLLPNWIAGPAGFTVPPRAPPRNAELSSTQTMPFDVPLAETVALAPGYPKMFAVCEDGEAGSSPLVNLNATTDSSVPPK